MSTRRLAASFNVEFWHSFRRPLFIALAVILGLTAFGLSSGKMSISSGDSSVGGTKAWITSEFAQTQTMTFLVLLYYAFFVAAAAGLSLLRDRETKVDSLLHSTPMTPGEYVWGRFWAVVGGFAFLLVWQALCSAFFNHVVPNANANDMRGPFVVLNYFMPVLTMGLPFIVFFAGVSMWVGERTRNPVLVFVVPVATLLLSGFLLWTWSPSWLSWRANQILQVIEPTGYRWLNETYLKVDRGVEFYNSARVPYVGLFWLNRLWLVVLGFGAVVMTQRSVARSARGVAQAQPRRWWRRAKTAAPAPVWDEAQTARPLRALEMQGGTPTFLESVRLVAGAELRELLRQAGLYIFIPLILMQTLGNVLLAVGAFDTPLLLTPGTTAVVVANQISVFVCFLLMFYTVESLERERSTGFAPILFATPLRTAAFLIGKALANSVVAGVVLVASLIACAIALLIQHTVSFSLTPYLLIWGLLIVPTFLVWTAFVTFAYAAVGNRYAAYSLSLAVLMFSGYKALTGSINWAGNWALWGAMRWSDLGFFETDRTALILNRVMVLGLAVFFTVLAVRLFGRRGADAVRTMHRISPPRLFGSTLRMLPYAAVPAVACVMLALQVHNGLEGGVAKKAKKDYWAKNLKTWFNAPLPDIAREDIKVKLDPRKHYIESDGTFALVNSLDSTLAEIPLTGGLFWRHVTWTMDGADYTPEDSKYLYVFRPSHPLAPGDSVTIGWHFDGRFPGGVTRNGGNTEEFILPSGVVLTGFSPSFAPVIGFLEEVGETKDNHTEPKRYPRDYWKGMTRAGYGATAWFPARIAITGPEDYTLNSVGECVSNTVNDGLRTQVWETDYPVKMLNIVCGHWKVKQGATTTIFYNEKHPYNVDQMSATLDAARKWYSKWFMDYPWKELKLSEFPGLAGYAQGFGTDITFSENIGFLTKNDAKTDATFLVTAHESAHQWWGNILTPANGPGADFLSEGMAHFSTMLLFEQVKGPRGRMEFAKGIEERYNNRRRANDERPMYDVDGKRPSDNTVIYDRGGWVFWMIYEYLGPERAMRAYRDFFQTWSRSRDHAALQDYVAAMRRYAPDPVAFDAFAKQWCEDKVVPQYVVSHAKKEKTGDGYDVAVTVKNVGTGTMPVTVAATTGERWKKADRDSSGTGPNAATYIEDPEYRDARGVVTLGAGEEQTLTIHCNFEPAKVVVDPDVRILQLKRKQAVASL
jgi:ABC-2 type transport system permease protein